MPKVPANKKSKNRNKFGAGGDTDTLPPVEYEQDCYEINANRGGGDDNRGAGDGDFVTGENPVDLDLDEAEPEPETVISASLNFSKNEPIQMKMEVSPHTSPSSETSSFATANSSDVSVKSAPPDLPSRGNKMDVMRAAEVVSTLPPTCTTLTTDGIIIYLVGTAHFSLKSQDDVRAVIQQTRPDLIMLELCKSRRNILHLDEEMLLREAQDLSVSKIMQTLRHSPKDTSKVQSLLHLLLLSMSASLTKKLGMAPGGEFRAAVKEVNNLDYSPILLLGDRPFGVTMSRAIRSLSLWQKVKLGWQFLFSSDDITKEEIELYKERDLLEKMLSEMTGEFPSITKVFVDERDYYMAHTLHMAAKTEGCSKLVAVVGMGHVPGISKYFGKTDDEEFERVASYPPTATPSTTIYYMKKGIKLALFGAVCYGSYKLLNRVIYGDVKVGLGAVSM